MMMLLLLSCSVVSNSSASPPGSFIRGISQEKNTGVGCQFLLQGIFLTQGLNPSLLHWQVDPLLLSHDVVLGEI